MSVIVVGAGPAGATAALTLARAGVTVRLLDRSNFPRNKPCGGGISVRVFRRFPYLRAELASIPTHTVGRLYLEGPGGEATVIESDEPAALLVRRVDFDALLVRLAVHAGAELVTGADIVQATTDDRRVMLLARDGRRFESPLVVAADGVNSVVARRLGINPGWRRSDVALDLMEETPRTMLRDVDPSTLWVAYGAEPTFGGSAAEQTSRSVREPARGRAAPEGYAYIFPKRDHVNVGIGYVLQHYRDSIDVAPYAVQQRFVSDLRARGILEGESVRKNFTPFLIPVGGPLSRPGRGRVLLAGDAGGFVNGFTAEGIYYAMVSGELAARAILEHGSADSQAPSGYERVVDHYCRECHREMGAELRDSVLLRRYLFADRRRIAEMVRGAAAGHPTTRDIVDFAIGRLSYATLRRRVLGRAPSLGIQLIWQWARTNLLRSSPGGATILRDPHAAGR